MLNSLLIPALAFVPAQDVATPSRQASVIAQDPAPAVAPDYWRQVARTLHETQGVARVFPLDPGEEALRAELGQRRVALPPVEDVEDLETIGNLLQRVLDLPVIVEPRAADAMMDEGATLTLNLNQQISGTELLELIVRQLQCDLRWEVREGAVVFTVEGQEVRDAKLFLHPVADLVPLFDPDDVTTLIQDQVCVGSWERDGVSIEPSGAFIAVLHDRDAQLDIERFLQTLRDFQASRSKAPVFRPTPGEFEYHRMRERLASIRLAPDFTGNGEGVPLREAAAFLSEISGMNILISPRIYDEFDEDELKLSFRSSETSLLEILDRIPLALGEIGWSLDQGVITFAPFDELIGNQVFAMYDVRSIVGPAPRDLTVDPRVEDELESLVMNASLLEDLIRNAIQPESWDNDPANSIRVSSSETGVLSVHQTPAVQAEIRVWLRQLQSMADTMLELRR